MQKQTQVSTTVPFSVEGQVCPGQLPLTNPREELNNSKINESVAGHSIQYPCQGINSSVDSNFIDTINTLQVDSANTYQVHVNCLWNKSPRDDHIHVENSPQKQILIDELSHDSCREIRTHQSPTMETRVKTPRPHCILDGINVPKVDDQILREQRKIFAGMWPNITPEATNQYPAFAELYQDIKSFNVPNFLGARRTLNSALNLKAWEHALKGYHDNEICFFLRYGWPVGYHKASPPAPVRDNHPSALAHSHHIASFIKEELTHEAVVGPFRNAPFKPWTRTSPLMTRPKKNSEKRRVIIDLSFPAGDAVNDGINIHSIYGHDSTYTLPGISDFITYVKKLGNKSWAWKADLSRAYRQLRVDPIDAPLLGLPFSGGVYIDLCPSFGCKSSSAACQRMAMAVVYLMSNRGWTILAYLDDFAGIEKTEHQAKEAYRDFLQLTKHLGLQLAMDKCAPPSQHLQWLGYDIDIVNMLVSIPHEKLIQVQNECTRWISKDRASEHMIQSLVGKLLHVANCINNARKFVTRILSTLRYLKTINRTWTTVGPEFKADVAWFLNYATQANGVALINPPRQPIYIECDSSLTGGGGSSTSHCYYWIYSKEHIGKYTQIHQLEALNLIVAYRTLCPPSETAGKKIVMVTDNSGSAYALSTGRTKDPVLAACARELWLHAACADHHVEIQHQNGNNIPLSDALSRAHFDNRKAKFAYATIRSRNLILVNPNLAEYVFFTNGL